MNKQPPTWRGNTNTTNTAASRVRGVSNNVPSLFLNVYGWSRKGLEDLCDCLCSSTHPIRLCHMLLSTVIRLVARCSQRIVVLVDKFYKRPSAWSSSTVTDMNHFATSWRLFLFSYVEERGHSGTSRRRMLHNARNDSIPVRDAGSWRFKIALLVDYAILSSIERITWQKIDVFREKRALPTFKCYSGISQ